MAKTNPPNRNCFGHWRSTKGRPTCGSLNLPTIGKRTGDRRTPLSSIKRAPRTTCSVSNAAANASKASLAKGAATRRGMPMRKRSRKRMTVAPFVISPRSSRRAAECLKKTMARTNLNGRIAAERRLLLHRWLRRHEPLTPPAAHLPRAALSVERWPCPGANRRGSAGAAFRSRCRRS